MLSPDKHCATCAHWRPFDDLVQAHESFPDDEPVEVKDPAKLVADKRRLGLCSLASNEDNARTSLALAVDESDYRHDLRTDATFGCTQHKEKGP